jgi:hypothetical protein
MRRTPRRKPSQTALLWPGTDELCPCCRGARQIYHRAVPPGVEVVGGKRIPCPVCQCRTSMGAALSSGVISGLISTAVPATSEDRPQTRLANARSGHESRDAGSDSFRNPPRHRLIRCFRSGQPVSSSPLWPRKHRAVQAVPAARAPGSVCPQGLVGRQLSLTSSNMRFSPRDCLTSELRQLPDRGPS